MAYPYDQWAGIAQNHISRGIASNFYPKLPFLTALGGMTLGNNNKKSLEIGRPPGEILTGKMVPEWDQLSIDGYNFYQPRIQRFEVDNGKWMGEFDTMPVVANASTASPDQANLATAKFGWSDLVEPILIWHETRDRALSSSSSREGRGLALAQVIDEATEVAFQAHIKKLNDGIWNGNPSNQALYVWNAPLGITQAFSATNTYGNVDRTVETVWQSQVDSTLTVVDIKAIIDDANITKRCRIFGRGIDLIVTTPALWVRFKNQVGTQMSGVRHLPDGIPAMYRMGVRQESLQVDNVYIVYDESCGANRVYCFDTATWRLAFHKKRNFTVTKFVDISQQSEGAKDADQAFIRTRIQFSCDNPKANVVYTAIGT